MPPKASSKATAEGESTTSAPKSRPGKRSNPASDGEGGDAGAGTASGGGGGSSAGGGKRRLAYAPRACDSCRRRKGKCDGRSPCEHCIGRGQPCNYSLTSSDWRSVLGNLQSSPGSGIQAPSLNRNPDTINDVGHMMMNLQSKLDSLTALIQQQGDAPAPPSRMVSVQKPPVATHGPTAPPDSVMEVPQSTRSPPQDTGPSPHQVPTRPRSGSSHSSNKSAAAPGISNMKFYGHMSPDYSFHMARNKVRRESSLLNPDADRNGNSGVSNIDQDDSDSGGEKARTTRNMGRSPGSGRLGPSTAAGVTPGTFTGLAELPLRMTLQEVLRLIGVYDEVIGEHNPCLDVGWLKEQAERWYEWAAGAGTMVNGTPKECPLDEDDSLILLLVIAIALAAEISPTQMVTCEQVYTKFEESIKAKFISPATSLKHVIIALLAGHFHHLRGTVRTSWRLCGLAGSMFMELGLHSKEVLHHVLESDEEREVAATISCAIITLDRQYSSSTGLPAHFQESSFNQELMSTVKTPYLKAMMQFLHISDTVSGTISRAIQSGSYDDDDAFELANFQIEQWRRKSLTAHAPALLERGYSRMDSLPSWPILLYLRANSVKGMLLRPFFFSSNRHPAAERNIKPALELTSSTVDTLVALDGATDIYRKQHAHFQHILSGACALLFLVLAYIADDPQCVERYPSGPVELAKAFRQVYDNSRALAISYCNEFRASRVLLRRLVMMRPILIKLDFISPEDFQVPQKMLRSSQSPQEFRAFPDTPGQLLQDPMQTQPNLLCADAPDRTHSEAQQMNQPCMAQGMGDRATWAVSTPNPPTPDPMSLNAMYNNNMNMFGGMQPYATNNMSMMRWLMSNGGSTMPQLNQWAFPGEEDFFNWNSS